MFKEVALQLTLEAIKQGKIEFTHTSPNTTDDRRETANQFNAKQISDFYNNIINAIIDNHNH